MHVVAVVVVVIVVVVVVVVVFFLNFNTIVLKLSWTRYARAIIIKM